MKIGLFPAVELVDSIPGANGRNSLLGGVRVVRSAANMPGIAAQEIYEWRDSALSFGLGAGVLVGGALASCLLVSGLPLLIASIASAAVTARSKLNLRNRELTSHAIEIQAGLLVGTIADLAAYEEIEAVTMSLGYDHLKGMSAADVLAGMRKRYSKARRWVGRNESRLRELATAANSAD